MAPESERANTDKVKVEERWYRDGRVEQKIGNGEWEMIRWPQNVPFVSVAEPTLTCSEVVESAPELCNDHYDCRDCAAYLAWRERRVQELEEAHELFLAQLKTALGIADDGRVWFGAGLLARAETLVLRESEWREQIRKGAKHEMRPPK